MLDVWKMGFTGKGVVVAVVDEGIEKNHKELQKNFVSIKHFFFQIIHSRTWHSSVLQLSYKCLLLFFFL